MRYYCIDFLQFYFFFVIYILSHSSELLVAELKRRVLSVMPGRAHFQARQRLFACWISQLINEWQAFNFFCYFKIFWSNELQE
jgi:hypothetical protein